MTIRHDIHGHKSNRLLNEETGEFDETLGNVKNDISELTNGKVSIMEDANTYKSTYDILKRISEIWDELTDKQQAGLLEKLFGKNRAQIGTAILSNFSAAEEAMEKMRNSAGNADKEMSIIMDSLEYKINAFKETSTGLWQNIFPREFVGEVVDFGTSVLNVFDFIVQNAGTALNALVAIVTMAFSVMMASSAKFAASVVAKLAVIGTALAPYSGLIIAVTALVGAAIAVNEKYGKSFDDVRQEAEEAKAKLGELNTQFDENQKKIETLNELKINGKISAAQQAELDNLIAQNSVLEAQIKLYERRYAAAHKEERRLAQKEAERLLSSNDPAQYGIDSALESYKHTQERLAEEEKKAAEKGKTETYGTKAYSKQVETYTRDLLDMLEDYQKTVDSLDPTEDADLIAQLNSKVQEVNVALGIDIKHDEINKAVQEAEATGKTLDELLEQREQNASRITELGKKRTEQGSLSYNEQKELVGLYEEQAALYKQITDEQEKLGVEQEKATVTAIKRATDIKVGTEVEDSIEELVNAYDSALNNADLSSLTKYGDQITQQVSELLKIKDLLNEEGGNETMVSAIDDLINQTLEDLGWSLEDITGQFEDVENAAEDTASGIEEVTERTKTFKETVSSINTIATEAFSDTGLSAESAKTLSDMFSELEGFDAEEFFQITSDGIHVNAEELANFTDQYYELEKARIDNHIADLVAQAAELESQLYNLTDAELAAGDGQALLEQYDGLQKQIYDAQLARAEIDGMTDAYSRYLAMKSMGEASDPIEGIAAGYKSAKDAIERGAYGSNELNGFLDMFFGSDRENDWQNNIDQFNKLTETIKGTDFSIMDFFTTDDNGKFTSDGVYNFLDAVKQIYPEMVKIGEDGGYSFDFAGEKIWDVADSLGFTKEMVQLLEQAMQTAGFDVQFDSISESMHNAAQELRDLDFLDDDWRIAGIDDQEGTLEQIKEITALMDQFKNADGEIDLSIPGAQAAMELLQGLYERYSGLSNLPPIEIPVDVVDDDYTKKIFDIQAKIQRLNNLQTQIDVSTSLGQDTTGLQEEFNTLKSEIESDPIITEAEINTETAQSTYESWKAAIEAGTITANIRANTGSETQETVQVSGEVKYSNKFTRQNAPTLYGTAQYTAVVNTNTVPTNIDGGTVTYTVKVVGNVPTGGSGGSSSSSASAYGTAHALGTAFKGGYWGTKSSGTALMGELGPEILVRDGHWSLVGENGAGFYAYRKGDIIFNARQTSEILKHGRVMSGNKRGSSFVSGTAFDSGSGPGRIVTTPRRITTGDYINQGGSGAGTSQQAASTASKEEKKKTLTKIDWIEVAVDRIERIITSMTSAVESEFLGMSKRLASSSDAISKIMEEISLASAGAARYLKEAEKVKISDKLKKLIQNGAIDITQYNDDTKKQIEEYQKWYEKYLSMTDKIDELHEDLANIYQDRVDMVKSDYENQIGELDHRIEMQQKNIDMLGQKGYIETVEFYQEMAKVEQERLNTLRSELTDLNYYFTQAMNSGEIEEYSESWYDMEKTIRETEEAIADANIKLEEYANTIRSTKWSWFDYALDRMNQITNETGFLIDLIDKYKLYDDNGQMNSYGMATLGLRAANYDVYMSKAAKYYSEMQKVQKELESDPYNKTLIARREELLGYQRSAIQAAEQEKEAVKSLVEEGFKAELDSMKELIDSYNDALDSEKDLYDFQKKITKSSDNISSLQKQIAAYANDDSEENRARMQKLQESLKTAQEDLRETEYDKYIDDQKELLDALYDEYEKLINARLDDVDQLMRDAIDTTNSNSADINATLHEEGAKVGYVIEQQLSDIFGSSGSATRYHDNVARGLSAVEARLEDIFTLVDSMVANSTGVKAYASGGLVTHTGIARLDGTANHPEYVLNPTDTARILSAAQLMNTPSALSALAGHSVSIGDLSSRSGAGGVNIVNNIEIERVMDYNDFVSQLQRDKKFENMMKDVVTGTAMGKSSLAKYKYSFG